MLDEVAGIERVRMLYVQLLYKCNYRCLHCFHGSLLDSPSHYKREQIEALLRHFVANYDLKAVTYLGGEPMMHPDIVGLAAYAHRSGLAVEICTNGHFGFRRQFEALAPWVSKLRVSLEGLRETNDKIRRVGSFDSAMRSIALATGLGIPVGITMTVTAWNVREVIPLARILGLMNVAELKLHRIRPVGSAAQHPELLAFGPHDLSGLRRSIQESDTSLKIIYDSDLFEDAAPVSDALPGAPQRLDRLEIDPAGGLTMSCKAVGLNANAFYWDKQTASVGYAPHAGDEFDLGMSQVLYRTA